MFPSNSCARGRILVASLVARTGRVKWAFELTVKRDTPQKERAPTKYRNSWGAKAVRVRATGSLRAHRYFAVGHSRRSRYSIP